VEEGEEGTASQKMRCAPGPIRGILGFAKPANMMYIIYRDFGDMLNEEQKRRIKLYSAVERNRIKADRRRADSAEAALGRGHAEMVQERNRALPHASQFVFSDRETGPASE
jgi:hypothetical protein